MKPLLTLALFLVSCVSGFDLPKTPRRLVILKVDGMGQDQLMKAIDAGQLPSLKRIFVDQGTIYENFYTRGISLSAPSWSMLDTGQHTVIRGNVEYDRFTGQVYDYLNFFPLYIGYARKRQVDMPGVEVLDRAGIPLLIDRFPGRFQSFQLFQHGVRWETLEGVLRRRFSSRFIFSTLEGLGESYDSLLEQQTQDELDTQLQKPEILYLDFFLGKVDHEGHATSEPAAILKKFREVDELAAHLWQEIQKSPLADRTIFVMVSDHGMNNVPGIISQTYNLTDLLNSPAGGAHHVITNREQLSDFKFKSLYPLLHRVINPSESSFYLNGESSRYPTAWLDIDGNERAALHFRNSDINKIHILLQQLARSDLDAGMRKAAAHALGKVIDGHRSEWASTATQLDEELKALDPAIDAHTKGLREEPKNWRLRQELDDSKTEREAYGRYLEKLKHLLAFEPSTRKSFKGRISDLIPEMSLGSSNTQEQLRHYLAGPAHGGLQLKQDGSLDEELSFRFIDYPKLFSEQRALNHPQPTLTDKPIDFVAMRIKDPSVGQHAYWLYRNENSQLEILTDSSGRIAVRPLCGNWRNGLPLALFEDPALLVPSGTRREDWLSEWHAEKDWLNAIHKTHYSNAVIGIIEELSPVAANVPGRPGINPTLLRYERRRRELVQADIHIFATDHWNFNVRFPNPGGNHGSFLRISTHSVWMMSGAGVAAKHIEGPVDSLEFARVLLQLIGR